jgi:hypothetical protein
MNSLISTSSVGINLHRQVPCIKYEEFDINVARGCECLHVPLMLLWDVF